MPLKPPEAPVDSLETFHGLDARVDVIEEAPLNVQDPRFGAQLDGVTDDWAALSACRAVAVTATKAEIYIPAGTLLINSSHTFNPISNLRVFGAGQGRTTIKAGTGTSSNLIGSDGSAVSNFSIESLTINCNSRTIVGLQFNTKGWSDIGIKDIKILSAAIAGVNLVGVARARVKGLYVDGVTVSGGGGVGLWLFNGTSDGDYEDIYIANTGSHGVALDAGTTGGVIGTTADLVRANRFQDIHCEDTAGSGVVFEGGNQNTIDGLILERCGLTGLPGTGLPSLYFNKDQSNLTSDDNTVRNAIILDAPAMPVGVRSGNRNQVRGIANGIGKGGSNSPAVFLYAFDAADTCDDNDIELNASDSGGSFLNGALLRGEAATFVRGNRVRGRFGRSARGPTGAISSSSGSVITVNFTGVDANTVENVVVRSGRKQAQIGVCAPMLGEAIPRGAVNQVHTANVAYLMRFVLDEDVLATLISVNVTNPATNNDACDVGIYNSDWTSRLASAGATTGKMNAGGIQTVSFTASVQLYVGVVYYAAFSYGAVGGTAATVQGITINSANNGALFGGSAGSLLLASKAASHPLPSSLAGSAAIAGTPFVGVRES